MARTRGTGFRVAAESRWPTMIALAAAVVIYVLLPGTFVAPLRWTVAGICVLCAVILLAINPRRIDAEYWWSRGISIGLGVVLLLANQVALVQLLIELVATGRSDGPIILVAAAQVWVTNVIGYSYLFWEMDRGGPVVRRRDPRDQLPPADFRFPQDEDDDTVQEVARRSSKVADWMPAYFDYLYFSATNAMAYSPTDVMPLTHRAKGLMLVESLSGFVILALVIARSVNLLG